MQIEITQFLYLQTDNIIHFNIFYMEAKKSNIFGIIQRNTLLRIPYFQRRYVWSEPDWKQFATDMESTLDSDCNRFLGAIILKEEPVSMNDRRNGISQKQIVIDGQQRLTTLCIFMKVLHMMVARNEDFQNQYLQMDDTKSPVIIHSCEDMPQFSSIMHLDTPLEISGNSNIVRAYNFFRTYLDERQSVGVSLGALLNTVNACITFVVISLSQDDDEQQIFDTINSLGVPLTTGELMKNFLYEANDEMAYRNSWRSMFDTDEARKFWDADASSAHHSKSKDNATIERFFHAFVRLKMWDFKDRLTEVQRKNFVKAENIFSTCKSFVGEFGMDKQQLAKEILEYAQLFRANLNEDILDTRIPQHSGIKRISCLINTTKNYVVLPYVLYVLHEVPGEAERNKIFDYLETYLVRRIITKNPNKDYFGLFSEYLICQRIVTCDALKAYIKDKDDSKNLAMPSDTRIRYALNNNKFDEQYARLILYLFETKLVKTSESKLSGGISTYYAESFMPRPSLAANENWTVHTDPADEENRRQLIGTIGNYFLLNICTEKGLKKFHNEDFKAKLPVLQRFSHHIRSGQLLCSLRNWDETAITNRNNTFASGFCKTIWPAD